MVEATPMAMERVAARQRSPRSRVDDRVLAATMAALGRSVSEDVESPVGSLWLGRPAIPIGDRSVLFPIVGPCVIFDFE